MLSSYLTRYLNAIYDTDRARVFSIVDEALANGITPKNIIFELVIPSIEMIMDRLGERNDINLCQHFFVSEIASEVTDKMIALFDNPPTYKANVVIGTSLGDFHGLGKKIVAGCLKAFMFNIYDLGLNVSAEVFVSEALKKEASIIAISSMMMHTARGKNGSIKVREILQEMKIENQIKIIVGGAPYRYDHNLYLSVGADSWAENGILAVVAVEKLLKDIKHDSTRKTP